MYVYSAVWDYYNTQCLAIWSFTNLHWILTNNSYTCELNLFVTFSRLNGLNFAFTLCPHTEKVWVWSNVSCSSSFYLVTTLLYTIRRMSHKMVSCKNIRNLYYNIPTLKNVFCAMRDQSIPSYTYFC